MNICLKRTLTDRVKHLLLDAKISRLYFLISIIAFCVIALPIYSELVMQAQPVSIDSDIPKESFSYKAQSITKEHLRIEVNEGRLKVALHIIISILLYFLGAMRGRDIGLARIYSCILSLFVLIPYIGFLIFFGICYMS